MTGLRVSLLGAPSIEASRKRTETDTRKATALLAYPAEEWSRIDRLAEDVARLGDRLARFPELGWELTRERARTLRRIAVGRLRYLVWYRHDHRGDGAIKLYRLFHSRQRTPKPRLPEGL